MSDRSDIGGGGPLFLPEGQHAVQGEGLEAGRIGTFVLVLFAVAAVVVWVSAGWFAAEADAARAEAAAEAGYPDRRRADIEADRLLGHFEVVDRDRGVYRIPIERAIDVVAAEARFDSTDLRPDE